MSLHLNQLLIILHISHRTIYLHLQNRTLLLISLLRLIINHLSQQDTLMQGFTVKIVESQTGGLFRFGNCSSYLEPHFGNR